MARTHPCRPQKTDNNNDDDGAGDDDVHGRTIMTTVSLYGLDIVNASYMHAGWTHQSSKDNQSVDSNLNRPWRFMGSRSILLQQPSMGGNLANKMPQKISDEQWLVLGMKNEGNGQLSEKQVTHNTHFSMRNHVMIQITLYCQSDKCFLKNSFYFIQ